VRAGGIVPGRRIGLTVSRQIRGDDPVGDGEPIDDVAPASAGPAEAMDEQQGLTRSSGCIGEGSTRNCDPGVDSADIRADVVDDPWCGNIGSTMGWCKKGLDDYSYEAPGTLDMIFPLVLRGVGYPALPRRNRGMGVTHDSLPLGNTRRPSRREDDTWIPAGWRGYPGDRPGPSTAPTRKVNSSVEENHDHRCQPAVNLVAAAAAVAGPRSITRCRRATRRY
jgi:hypothetical protein